VFERLRVFGEFGLLDFAEVKECCLEDGKDFSP